MKPSPLYKKIIPVLFILLLLFPYLNKHLKILPDTGSLENRALAEKPVFDIGRLDAYPKKYDQYYKDHFSLRNRFVRSYNYMKLKMFNISALPEKCIVGKDDFLYLAKDEMNAYNGVAKFTEDELLEFKNVLEKRQKYLEGVGAKYYFFICPVKQNVYPEFVPDVYQNEGVETRTEQLLAFLENNCSVPVVYLLPALTKGKENMRIYKKTDNHWNNLGGIVATQAMVDVIKKDFPVLESIADHKIVDIDTTFEYGGNVASMLYLQDILGEENYTPIIADTSVKEMPRRPYPVPDYFPYPWEYEMVRTTSNDSLPKLLCVRESFGNAFVPYLSAYFSESVYIFDSWQHMFNKSIVDSEKPDVYITSCLESQLESIINVGRDSLP